MQARKEPIGEGSRSAIIEQVNLGNDAKQGPENYSAQGEGVGICTPILICHWLGASPGGVNFLVLLACHACRQIRLWALDRWRCGCQELEEGRMTAVPGWCLLRGHSRKSPFLPPAHFFLFLFLQYLQS